MNDDSKMDRDRVRRAYDTVADGYAALLPDMRFEHRLDRAMIDEFARAVVESDPPTVLDAGCGTGRLAGYLSQRGCRVTGVDVSGEMIRNARETYPLLDFDVGDLADLPYPSEAFAGVTAWYSLIHTPPQALPDVFAEFSRVSRSGGSLLLGFQRGTGTRRIHGAYGYDVDMSAVLHDPDPIAQFLSKAGFTVSAVLTRGPEEPEKPGQAVMLARRV